MDKNRFMGVYGILRNSDINGWECCGTGKCGVQSRSYSTGIRLSIQGICVKINVWLQKTKYKQDLQNMFKIISSRR